MNQRKNWPSWLKKRIDLTTDNHYTWETIRDLKLNTVCASARCPNLPECFSKRRVAFLILGNNCTRKCRFCAIQNNLPQAVNELEPQKVAGAVKELGLNYVVITSVSRDDLSDGGASQFSKTIKEVHQTNSQVKIEVLTPDFQGSEQALQIVLEAKPDVFNHNLETVPRLYDFIRPQADYQRSLNLLSLVKQINPNIVSKSGLMLGLGEKEDEVLKVFDDLIKIKCEILTLGQYLKPAKAKVEVKEFINPEKFKQYKQIAKEIGFKHVFSGPWVRSSYQAQEVFEAALRPHTSVWGMSN